MALYIDNARHARAQSLRITKAHNNGRPKLAVLSSSPEDNGRPGPSGSIVNQAGHGTGSSHWARVAPAERGWQACSCDPDAVVDLEDGLSFYDNHCRIL